MAQLNLPRFQWRRKEWVSFYVGIFEKRRRAFQGWIPSREPVRYRPPPPKLQKLNRPPLGLSCWNLGSFSIIRPSTVSNMHRVAKMKKIKPHFKNGFILFPRWRYNNDWLDPFPSPWPTYDFKNILFSIFNYKLQTF